MTLGVTKRLQRKETHVPQTTKFVSASSLSRAIPHRVLLRREAQAVRVRLKRSHGLPRQRGPHGQILEPRHALFLAPHELGLHHQIRLFHL